MTSEKSAARGSAHGLAWAFREGLSVGPWNSRQNEVQGPYILTFGREATVIGRRLLEFRFVGVLRRMEKKLATLGEAPPVKDSARTRKALKTFSSAWPVPSVL